MISTEFGSRSIPELGSVLYNKIKNRKKKKKKEKEKEKL